MRFVRPGGLSDPYLVEHVTRVRGLSDLIDHTDIKVKGGYVLRIHAWPAPSLGWYSVPAEHCMMKEDCDATDVQFTI